MTRTTLLLPLLLLAAACAPNSGTLVEDDVRMDLTGRVIDRMAGDEPVSDAWIVVDTGDELITARSGADGGFSIPDLPGNAPIVATIAAEGRQAVTNATLVLSEAELPMEVGLPYVDADRYEMRTHTVSGRMMGAPAGAWVLISGAGMPEYAYVQAEQGPTPFEFAVERLVDAELDEPFLFSGLAFVNETGQMLGVGVGEAEWDDDMEADLAFAGGDVVELEVHSPAPLLDGDLLEELDSEYMTSLCLSYLNDSWGAFVGWNEDWATDSDGFVYEASYVPVDGYPVRTAVYLTDDLEQPEAMSYASVLLPDGAEEVTVAPLDSPHLDTHADFGPGASIAWDPVAGADRTVFYVRQEEATAWVITTDDDQVSFPTLPDDFDLSLLVDGEGTWHVRASRSDEVDGEFDRDGPYLVAETWGGDVELE